VILREHKREKSCMKNMVQQNALEHKKRTSEYKIKERTKDRNL
jgi:hypothetical protein